MYAVTEEDKQFEQILTELDKLKAEVIKLKKMNESLKRKIKDLKNDAIRNRDISSGD